MIVDVILYVGWAGSRVLYVYKYRIVGGRWKLDAGSYSQFYNYQLVMMLRMRNYSSNATFQHIPLPGELIAFLVGNKSKQLGHFIIHY